MDLTIGTITGKRHAEEEDFEEKVTKRQTFEAVKECLEQQPKTTTIIIGQERFAVDRKSLKAKSNFFYSLFKAKVCQLDKSQIGFENSVMLANPILTKLIIKFCEDGATSLPTINSFKDLLAAYEIGSILQIKYVKETMRKNILNDLTEETFKEVSIKFAKDPAAISGLCSFVLTNKVFELSLIENADLENIQISENSKFMLDYLNENGLYVKDFDYDFDYKDNSLTKLEKFLELCPNITKLSIFAESESDLSERDLCDDEKKEEETKFLQKLAEVSYLPHMQLYLDSFALSHEEILEILPPQVEIADSSQAANFSEDEENLSKDEEI
jgi:hypothetical protein